MSVYSITSAPQLRSIFQFNRVSLEIADSLRRLETGQRIITGKDDPSGLIMREGMRVDISGIQAAQRTTKAANEFLATAETGLANVSRILLGDINTDERGLLGLIYDENLPSDMKQQQIEDLLNMIDNTIRSTNYNGKRMLDGSMTEALFQLGKDVQDSQQYRMALPNMTVSQLGGASGTLVELRAGGGIDLDTDAGKAQAYAIVNEAVNMVAKQRGTIGAVQKHVLESNAQNLDVQLERVSEAEGFISNVDVALETSRLNRAELIAQAAMNSILYSRNYERWLANLFL